MNHSYSFSLTDNVCSGLRAGSVVSSLDSAQLLSVRCLETQRADYIARYVGSDNT